MLQELENGNIPESEDELAGIRKPRVLPDNLQQDWINNYMLQQVMNM